MPKAPPPPMPDPAAPPAALQAQILATEHWSLLASRSTTQSEVLTRISMFLTFVSATLVSLALIGQATAFGADFPFVALALLTVALLVGILTQVRVFNVAGEDMMYVIAMNRLRAAYVELAPGIERWLLASAHDDRPGVQRTYSFFARRNSSSVILGSSMMFIGLVNGALIGLIAATLVLVAGGATLAAVITGVGVAVLFVLGGILIGYGIYVRTWRVHVPISPSPISPSPVSPTPQGPE